MSFVAISKVKYPASIKQEIQQAGIEMVCIAKQQPGFISISFHQSCDSDETMMIWEWESKSYHETCMSSDSWNSFMQQSQALFATDGIEFSIETYDRLA